MNKIKIEGVEKTASKKTMSLATLIIVALVTLFLFYLVSSYTFWVITDVSSGLGALPICLILLYFFGRISITMMHGAYGLVTKRTVALKKSVALIVVFSVTFFLLYLIFSCMIWLYDYAPPGNEGAIMFSLLFLCFGTSTMMLCVVCSLITGRIVIYERQTDSTGRTTGRNWSTGKKILDVRKKTNPTSFRQYLKLFFCLSLGMIILGLLILVLSLLL